MSDLKTVLLVHGESGVGKTPFLDTAPGPRLLLDAEGGSDWTDSPKIEWDPAKPFPDSKQVTPDTTVVAFIRDFRNLELAYQWLAAGGHYFQSVSIDSITEVQKRCKDAVGGSGELSVQMWGQLLTKMEVLIRQFRDLKKHPTNPVNVCFSAITVLKDDKWRPDVQGALARQLPQYAEIMGYMYTQISEDGSGKLERRMLIQPQGQFSAKDRPGKLTKKFGNVVTLRSGEENICDLNRIVNILNNKEE